MDSKHTLAQQRWDPSDEEQIFGQQAPFASPAGGAHHTLADPPFNSTPFHTPGAPPLPFDNDPYKATTIPSEAPPMYTKDPFPGAPQEQQRPRSQAVHHPIPQHDQAPVAPTAPRAPQALQAPRPTQPLQPPQPPQHYQHAPPQNQTQPISYGAIPHNNNNVGNVHPSAYYQLPRGPPDDSSDSEDERRSSRRNKRYRRRKEGMSCCNRCCLILIIVFFVCWYIKGLFGPLGGGCTLPDDAESETVSHSFPASSNLALKFHHKDSIFGNIEVFESESMQTDKIVIRVFKRASSRKLLGRMEHSLIFAEGSSPRAESWVHLNSEDKDEKKRWLKGNCARADVEIIYPKSKPGTGTLTAVTNSGDVMVRFRNPLATFGSLILSVINGEITVEKAHVAQKTELSIVNGPIRAMLVTAGQVDASSVNGALDVIVDTHTPQTTPENLDVHLSTLNGPINLDLMQRFQGHFKLNAAVGKPSIKLSDEYPDQVFYTSNKNNELQGWINKDESEPSGPLPRITVEAVNGVLRLATHGRKS